MVYIYFAGLSDKATETPFRGQEDRTDDVQPRRKRAKASPSGCQQPLRAPKLSSNLIPSSQQSSLSPSLPLAQVSDSSEEQQDQERNDSPSTSALAFNTESFVQEDDNFIAVHASEDELDLEPRDDDGLGTLGKVWSISQVSISRGLGYLLFLIYFILLPFCRTMVTTGPKLAGEPPRRNATYLT